MTITDLQLTKNRKRINIYIDGEFSFAINKDVAVDSRLYKGLEITEKQIIKLKDSDSLQRCMDAAFSFLSYRPRSEMEVKQRLRRRGFSQEMIEKVIYKLKKKSFINDAEFVKYWIDNRAEFNPKGRTVLKIELKQKGIRRDLLNDMLGDVNEENNAYRAALKKSHVINNLEYDEFKSRLFTYLKWRGFGYEIIETVCKRIWQENKADSASLT
jgi:regulatory protein